ncbi:hypothetical protein ABIC63_000241 [Pseudacidovorax sp. 1753]|uniref:hypothetical protein n=1 Tax=Pseudacidovorax sp. 1753 TaxID=3156419 RepID=UPI00339AC0C9
MTASDQLSLFEPEGPEALTLLRKHLADAARYAKQVVQFEALCMPGAARLAQSESDAALGRAVVLAIFLDLEREAGL